MRHAPRAFLLAALLVAAASPSLAQGSMALGLSLDPPSRTVQQGWSTDTWVVVENDGVTSMQVDLTTDPSALGITFERSNVTVGPQQTERVRANVTTAGLAPGNHSVVFRARERQTGGLVAPAEASALFHVVVQAKAANATGNATGNSTGGPTGNATGPPPGHPPPPPGGNSTEPPPGDNATSGDDPPRVDPPAGNETEPATNETTAPPANDTLPPAPPPRVTPPPTVTPTTLTLTGAPHENVPFQVAISNPHDQPQTFDALLRLPLGWAGDLAPSRLGLAPNETTVLSGTIQPLADAKDDRALLTVTGPGGDAIVTILLRVVQPVPPACCGAPAETDREPIVPTAERDTTVPPPEGVLVLRVEPEEIRLAPGQRGVAQLVVVNGLSSPVDVRTRLALPEGFVHEAADLDLVVPPGETAGFPLVLRADEALALGTRVEASAALEGHDAAAAPFALLVTRPDVMAERHAPEPEEPPWLLALVLTAAGGVALALSWAWRRWQIPLLALYARLRPSRVLDHPTRAAIRDLVAAEPGVRLADVQRRLGLANGRLRHHVDRLVTTGVLKAVADGPHRRLYPAEAGRVEPTPGLAERALQTLQQEGPMPAPALAARLGVSRQALHYHVKRLAAQGLLDARRVERELLLSARAHETAPRRGAAGAAP